MCFIFRYKKKIETELNAIEENTPSLIELLDRISTKVKSDRTKKLLCGGTRRKNEEATKLILIQPILRALGYDTADENVVMPERIVVTPDGSKKVDYAISHDGKMEDENISVLVEAKAINVDLDHSTSRKKSPVQQLERYFNNTPTAKLGILSNGRELRFYVQTTESLFSPNAIHKMDIEPVLTIALDDVDYSYDSAIEYLRRERFEINNMEEVRKRSKEYLKAQIRDDELSQIVDNACREVVSRVREITECKEDILPYEDVQSVIIEKLGI